MLLAFQVGSVTGGGASSSPAASLPSGMLVMATSGGCPSGTTEATDIAGKMLFTVSVASATAGGTGGSDAITPAGTNGTPTFTGSALGTHSHGVGTLADNAVGAGTPTGTVAWPAGVPTFTGTSSTVVVNHTHTISITDPGHTHTQSVNSGTTGASSGYTPDTSTSTSTTSGYSTASATTGITASSANPGGGSANYTPAGTNAWPAGVPTFSGSALGTHSHGLTGSSAAVSGGTPAGTVSAPSFTGTQFDNRSAFVNVIVCRAN